MHLLPGSLRVHQLGRKYLGVKLRKRIQLKRSVYIPIPMRYAVRTEAFYANGQSGKEPQVNTSDTMSMFNV